MNKWTKIRYSVCDKFYRSKCMLRKTSIFHPRTRCPTHDTYCVCPSPPLLFVSGNLVSSLLVARISLSRYSPMSCQNISTGMIEPSMIFVKKSRCQGFLIFTQKIMLKTRNKWFWTQHQMTCQDVPKNVYVQTHELPKNWVQNGLDRPLKSHLPEKFGQWRLFRPCPWPLLEQNCAEYCPKVLVIM